MIHRSAYRRTTAQHLATALLAVDQWALPGYSVLTRSVIPAILAMFLLVFPGQQVYGQAELTALNTSCDNYIRINGSTNINTFSLDQFVPEDVICGTGDSRWIRLPEQEVYLIRVPVRNFHTSNKLVYRDFLALIDVQQHPYISIFMEEAEFQKLLEDRRFSIPRIGITVAGHTRYYNIPCTVSDCVDGKIAVSGHKTLKLTDFKLAPPEKTLGLIRVHDELNINFEFSLPSEQGIKLSKI